MRAVFTDSYNIMPKVSVIVPIYGAEKYIEQCVKSLMEQTLDNVEYIFIDDYTPDNSIEILKKTLSKYPARTRNVVLCHNYKNLGQAQTRKKGIMMAKGDYVIHCDPDDWVDNDWLELLYEEARHNNADITWCGFESVRRDGTIKSFPNKALNNIDDFLDKLETGVKWGSLCLHLVKRKIVQSDKIIWPNWNYCEDLSLIFQYAAQANSVVYVNKCLYKYRQNMESITSQRSREGIIRNIEGEIRASLQGLAICRQLGLNRKHSANILSRIYRAKARFWMTATDSHDFCKLWLEHHYGLQFVDIWKSSLNMKDKIVISSIYFKVYPLIKG